METRRVAAAILLGAMILAGLLGVTAHTGRAAISDDLYAPLKLYDGKWDVAMAGEKGPTRLENHCAKTGLFFMCEQTVNGKTGALIVFLPFAKMAAGGEEYRTQALHADASPGSGDWGKLTIEGDKWMYFWESSDHGKTTHWRNVNNFSGTDKIHFEIQSSEDGTTWKTQNSGEEQRVK